MENNTTFQTRCQLFSFESPFSAVNTNMQMIVQFIHIRLTDASNSALLQCDNKSRLGVIAGTLSTAAVLIRVDLIYRRSCFVLFD